MYKENCKSSVTTPPPPIFLGGGQWLLGFCIYSNFLLLVICIVWCHEREIMSYFIGLGLPTLGWIYHRGCSDFLWNLEVSSGLIDLKLILLDLLLQLTFHRGSRVAIPLYQEGQHERTCPIFALSSLFFFFPWFFPLFLIFSLFFRFLANFSWGATLPPPLPATLLHKGIQVE